MITLAMVRGGHRVSCTDCGYSETHLDVDEAIHDYQGHRGSCTYPVTKSTLTQL